MENSYQYLEIKPTEKTPKIVINAENIYRGITIDISGKSYPEDVRTFYIPVFQWIDNLKDVLTRLNIFSGKGINITLTFRIEYFNSSSCNFFQAIIKNLTSIKTFFPDINLVIYWLYDDIDIQEAGIEFKSLSTVPFYIIKNRINISGTDNSPHIIINPEENLFEISGRSIMEKPYDFFKPVINWVEDYGLIYFNNDFKFNFKISYFNTPSSKIILEVIEKIEEISQKNNTQFTINWFYDNEEDDSDGRDIESNVNLNFNFIPY